MNFWVTIKKKLNEIGKKKNAKCKIRELLWQDFMHSRMRSLLYIYIYIYIDNYSFITPNH